MYYHKFDKKLKEQYFNVWKFSNHDKNRFNLLLQNDVSPYEYMDDWEKFNETSLPKKEDCYSHLNMEDKYGLVQIMLTKKELVKMLKLKIYENIMICMFKVIHYFYMMHLKTLETCVLKYANLILQNFF